MRKKYSRLSNACHAFLGNQENNLTDAGSLVVLRVASNHPPPTPPSFWNDAGLATTTAPRLHMPPSTPFDSLGLMENTPVAAVAAGGSVTLFVAARVLLLKILLWWAVGFLVVHTTS